MPRLFLIFSEFEPDDCNKNSYKKNACKSFNCINLSMYDLVELI